MFYALSSRGAPHDHLSAMLLLLFLLHSLLFCRNAARAHVYFVNPFEEQRENWNVNEQKDHMQSSKAQEELSALRAIYGDDVCVQTTPSGSTNVRLAFLHV